MLEYRAEIPSTDQFARLFETTGWNEIYRASPEELYLALSHSWCVLAAYDGGQLVGFGRVVSDQALHAMIYDLIVLPAYQGGGIGGEILQRLVCRCQQAGIRDIQLFCARGKRAFHEKRGFIARPDDAPGMQYRCRP
jgi:N-acetylglutamate synthase-like GNAT family acetyltransferase